jgi:hypothetical protein
MNDNNSAVMEAPTITQIDVVMEETPTDVMIFEAPEAEEVMVLHENINPKMVDELVALDPEAHDIADEIGQMDTFKEYQREIFADMRGYTSDQF